jgi:hypothetical protein
MICSVTLIKSIISKDLIHIFMKLCRERLIFAAGRNRVGGSRFWFWVPFRQNGIKNGINLNCDWTILFHFLFHAVSRPKRKRINNYIGIFYSKGHTSTFGCKKENVWCTYRKFAKLLENNMFESSNIEQRNMEGGKVNRNR